MRFSLPPLCLVNGLRQKRSRGESSNDDTLHTLTAKPRGSYCASQLLRPEIVKALIVHLCAAVATWRHILSRAGE